MTTAPVYSASKAGLIHFARSVTPRLAKKGIRVCTICPQAVQTPLVILTKMMMAQTLFNLSASSMSRVRSRNISPLVKADRSTVQHKSDQALQSGTAALLSGTLSKGCSERIVKSLLIAIYVHMCRK